MRNSVPKANWPSTTASTSVGPRTRHEQPDLGDAGSSPLVLTEHLGVPVLTTATEVGHRTERCSAVHVEHPASSRGSTSLGEIA